MIDAGAGLRFVGAAAAAVVVAGPACGLAGAGHDRLAVQVAGASTVEWTCGLHMAREWR